METDTAVEGSGGFTVAETQLNGNIRQVRASLLGWLRMPLQPRSLI